MRPVPVFLNRGLGIVLGVVIAATAHGQTITVVRAAQQKTPAPKAAPAPSPASVRKIVVFDGPNRSVHYVTAGNVAPADRLTAYELERAENALAYYHDLQRLKQQYVGSERVMEPQRRYVQQQLYGSQIRFSTSSSGSVGYGYGGYGYGGWGGLGWGGYPRSFSGYSGSTSYQMIRSLQFGVGDEGRIKSAMAPAIAHDASAERAPAILRDYEAAAARAAASTLLSKDLGLQKGPAKPGADPKK